MRNHPDFGKIDAMKRLRRWLFNGLAALSLLLCLATLATWFLTLNRPHGIEAESAQNIISLASWKGQIAFDEFSRNAINSMNPSDSADTRMAKYVKSHSRHFQVPHWAVALCLAVAPAYWIVVVPKRRRQQKRSLAGFCLNCGYDLRATPNRCPECGTIPSETKVISS
jgi:hypothetical protein